MPEEPLVFLKPNTSVIGPGDAIVYPPTTSNLHFEGEIALVMDKVARNVAAADALSHVFGMTAANDVTARDLQKSDPQWTRGKGFDTFCPLGPVIQTEFDADAIGVRTLLDGESCRMEHLPISCSISDRSSSSCRRSRRCCR